MKYKYVTNVRENDKLRAGFNDLTQKTFYFNFINWYESGFWQDKYIPHVLVDGDKVVSNISVNLMKFRMCGEEKNFIQLGTVMTDPDYRGKGLNRYIMENILEEYKDKVDGIYLFGNDSVEDYYPRFGFTPIHEYDYCYQLDYPGSVSSMNKGDKYRIEKIDITKKAEADKLYQYIREYEACEYGYNPNDDFALYHNVGLFGFWIGSEFGENIYYLPEKNAYIIAGLEGDILKIYQIIGRSKIDMKKLAVSFDQTIKKIKLDYSPADKDIFDINLHKVEDSTLFILGDSLKRVETEKMMFPVISHA